MIVHSNGAQPQNNLSVVTDRDKSSLKRLIDTLERKNFVARIPSETDKRVNIIHLTKLGKTTIEETLPIMRGLLDKLQHGISGSEMKTCIGVMEKIQENINKNI